MADGDLLADVPQEGQSVEEVLDTVDKELQDEKPAESLPEKLELPDESILKKNSAWEEMRVAREEAEEKTRKLEERLNALEKDKDEVIEVEKSDFVKSLVGENDDVERKWAEEKISLKEELKQEIIREQLESERKAQEQKEYWLNWTNERLSKADKEFNLGLAGNESKENEFRKMMHDISPTDEQGNLDFTRGAKLFLELNKSKEVEETQKTQVKKNIADATVSKETSIQKNKDYYTSQDLRGKDWRSIVNN